MLIICGLVLIVDIDLYFFLLVLLLFGLHKVGEVLVFEPADVVVFLKLKLLFAAVVELVQMFFYVDKGFVGGV